MTEELRDCAAARARMSTAGGSDVVIFRENPVFSYFSGDERADSVLLHDDKIFLVGPKEIEERFHTLDEMEYCIAPPYFEFRSGKECSPSDIKWFSFPLSGEIKFLISQKKRMGEVIEAVISELGKESTERSVAQSLKDRLCSAGFPLYYEPIIGFDENTLKVWNLPGENKLERIMYVEAAAKVKGLTVIYSNSFLVSSGDEYLDAYRESIKGVEAIKSNFVEGKTVKDVLNAMEGYRGENLYLTVPLFPFGYHAIPGPDDVIRTGEAAVFDIWVRKQEFAFRRKVAAVSGSYRARII